MKRFLEFWVAAYLDSFFVRAFFFGVWCLGGLMIAGAAAVAMALTKHVVGGHGLLGRGLFLQGTNWGLMLVLLLKILIRIMLIYSGIFMVFFPWSVRRWHWVSAVAAIPLFAANNWFFQGKDSLDARLAGCLVALLGVAVACIGIWLFSSLYRAHIGQEGQWNKLMNATRSQKRERWGIWKDREDYEQ